MTRPPTGKEPPAELRGAGGGIRGGRASGARHSGQVRLRCRDAVEARRLRDALAPDDPGSLAVDVEGDWLVLHAVSPTPMGLLRTLDDALACLRGAGVV